MDDGTAHDPQAAAEHRLAEVAQPKSVDSLNFFAVGVDERNAHLTLAAVPDLVVRRRPQLHLRWILYIVLGMPKVKRTNVGI